MKSKKHKKEIELGISFDEYEKFSARDPRDERRPANWYLQEVLDRRERLKRGM